MDSIGFHNVKRLKLIESRLRLGHSRVYSRMGLQALDGLDVLSFFKGGQCSPIVGGNETEIPMFISPRKESRTIPYAPAAPHYT